MRYSPKELVAVGVVLLLVVLAIVAAWMGSPELASTCIALLGLVIVVLLVDNRRHERDRFQRMTRLTLDKARENRMRFEELGAGFRTSAARIRDVDAGVRRQLTTASKESESVRNQMRSQYEGLRHRIGQAEVDVVREVAATLELRDLIPDPPAPLPPLGGWAIDAAELVQLLHLVSTRRPGLVVECGSGSSTVWLAHAVRQVGGRLVALEHEADYAAQTRRMLADQGLSDVAEVRLAPLTAVSLDDESVSWYDVGAVEDLAEIDLLLIDGPPGSTGPQARYPAVPILRSRLAPDAVIGLDDAQRPDERAALERWLDAWSDLERAPSGSPRFAVLEVRSASVVVPDDEPDRMPS